MLGVGVDDDDPGDLAFDPGLLERLTCGRLGDGLSEVYRAAGERSVAVVRVPDRQDFAGTIGHDDVDGRDEDAGTRGIQAVVVVDPAGEVNGSTPSVLRYLL